MSVPYQVFRPEENMIYAAFVTMKDLKYHGFSEVYICSVDEKNSNVAFDRKYPKLKIFYNNVGSLVHPDYFITVVNLSDVWLIGKSYWDMKNEYYYEDNAGVNHPNAIAALKKNGF